jgi:hypothetical protein
MFCWSARTIHEQSPNSKDIVSQGGKADTSFRVRSQERHAAQRLRAISQPY